jgi:hypothetical protein
MFEVLMSVSKSLDARNPLISFNESEYLQPALTVNRTTRYRALLQRGTIEMSIYTHLVLNYMIPAGKACHCFQLIISLKRHRKLLKDHNLQCTMADLLVLAEVRCSVLR